MDIQLLVNAASGRTTSGATKGQGAGGDFASDLAGAAQARQPQVTDASRSSPGMPARHAGAPKQPLGASLNETAHPTDRTLDVVGQNALLSGASPQSEPTPHALLPSLGLQEATDDLQSLHAAISPLPDGDVKAALKVLNGDADLLTGDEWEAIQTRLELIDKAGRLEIGEAVADISPVAQATSPRPETISLRDAGHEPRGNALLQTIATDALDRQGRHQAMVTQIDQTAERTSGLETASSRSAIPSEELPQRFPVANDTLMASRSDAARTPGGFELTGQGLNPSTASTISPNAQASIPAPVSSPAWPQQLGQQLVRLSQGGGEQRVELQLHPAELGPLSVSLKMGDQGAQAQFISAHAQVRQALEQAIPQLREALAEQGISLGETSVGEQRSGNGDSAPRQPGGMLTSAGPVESDEGPSGDINGTGTRELNLDGRVDLYA